MSAGRRPLVLLQRKNPPRQASMVPDDPNRHRTRMPADREKRPRQRIFSTRRPPVANQSVLNSDNPMVVAPVTCRLDTPRQRRPALPLIDHSDGCSSLTFGPELTSCEEKPDSPRISPAPIAMQIIASNPANIAFITTHSAAVLAPLEGIFSRAISSSSQIEWC